MPKQKNRADNNRPVFSVMKKNFTKWNSRTKRSCRPATSSIRANVHPVFVQDATYKTASIAKASWRRIGS